MAATTSETVRCAVHQLKEETYTEEIAEYANSLSDLSVYDLNTSVERTLKSGLRAAQNGRRRNRNRSLTCLRCADAQHRAQV